MELNELSAQARYARWLAWGTRVGLAALLLALVAYLGGLLSPLVPIERLPALWVEPASALLERTGVEAGWGWAAFADRGDMLLLAAVALLASCSIPCLIAVVPVFGARRERAFMAMCVVQIAVLLFAASGLLAIGH